MTWFEELTGCREDSPEQVRALLSVDSGVLRSSTNGGEWRCGQLELVSLRELRARARALRPPDVSLSAEEVVADVRALHEDPSNRGALFQVASQFNLLEMASPMVTPESGVGVYEEDFTQGPSCAIAAGAGTIYRNYFVEVDGKPGQSANRQIDCLAAIGELLGNSGGALWEMVNGYALPTENGLQEINWKLASLGEIGTDALRQSLQIGIQWDTQVTLGDASHVVSQAYCSAMPVAYTPHARELWAPLAKLILEAAYEATICAAMLNASRGASRRLFLTLLGGGAFGNEPDWIFEALRRAFDLHPDCGLEAAIVSHGWSNDRARRLAREL